MRFERVGDPHEFVEHLRHRRLHRRLVGFGGDARRFGDVLRRADAGDHVLALRVDEEFAVELIRAGRGVAREGDARRRRLAHVAEHHRLHVDGRAPAGGNVVQPAVGDGALVHPRREHRADRAPQLLDRVLRERLADLALPGLLVFADDVPPVVGGQIRVEAIALGFLVEFQHVLEIVVVDVEHHVRIHLDEAAVGIEGEALVAGAGRQRADRGVVEAEIEDGVHHARHRGAGAGPHRHQQRIGRVAEFAPGQLADMGERRRHLRRQVVRIAVLVIVVVGADFGGDREPRRHRQPQVGHFREVGALAAEQVLHAALAFGFAVAEGVDPFGHRRSPWVVAAAPGTQGGRESGAHEIGSCIGAIPPYDQLKPSEPVYDGLRRMPNAIQLIP